MDSESPKCTSKWTGVEIVPLDQLLAHYGALLGAFLAADALSFGVACAVALVTLWQLIGRAERRPLALRALRDISPAALLLMTAGSIKVGVYGMLRFGLPLVPNLAPLVIHRAPGLALALAVVAAAGAGWQSQWVRMIAYLSMSQAATALAGFLTLTPAGISSGVQFSIVHALLTTAGLTAVYVGGRWHDGDALLSERRVALSPVRAVLLFAGALAAGLPALRSWSGVPPSVWWNGMAFVGMLVSLGIVTVSGDRALREALVDTPTAVSTPRVSIAPAMGVVLLLAAAAWTGTSPNTLTRTLRVPSLKLAAQVDARYRSEFVAACDTTVTPELRAASPAAQFLAAAPCGPDGKPLEGSVVVPLTPAAGAR